jgi:hypothetical protein
MIVLVETLKSNNITMRNYLLGKFDTKITLQMLQLQLQPSTLSFESIMYLCWNSRVNKCFLKCESKFSKNSLELFTRF